MNLFKYSRRLSLIVLASILYGCASQPIPPVGANGKLRMGLYKGSPTSILPGKTFEDSKGVGFELGRLFADNFDYAYSPIIFEKNADVLAAAKQGRVDMIFTNVSPERADDFAFSKPILKIEKGYLIGPQRGIQNMADIDVPSRKIGVSEGSSSLKELAKVIKYAQIVTTSSMTSAIAMLKAGRIDAFSSNKAILYEMSDSVPGSRVLLDVIGYESMSIGLPKERAAAIPKINDWIDGAVQQGQFNEMVKNSGLRGIPLTK
jgi:polar amino acid transport system substrate-binding protein